MVEFNELIVNLDTNTMTIDVSVPDESYYEDIYIDSIIIDNQDTYVGTGPSSQPVYSYIVPSTKELPRGEVVQNNLKHLRLVINAYDMNCSIYSLFLVYVRVKGIFKPNTPCGCDNITTIASVTSMKPFYNNMMQYIREVGNNCTMPSGFIDQFLRIKSLEVAIRTKNYPQAIQLWKRYRENISVTRKGGCGCHGIT